MKLKKLIPLFLVLPVLVSCGEKKVQKDPLVIPNVDVLNLKVTLPNLPTYNTGAMQSDADYDYIDLYEISDFHGAVHTDGKKMGLARLATYLEGKRAENEGGTLVLSSGDMFQGSADSNLTRGYVVNYAMSYMGFDAMAVGNHEFDWTDEWLKNNAELKYNNYQIPYLGINIVDKRTNDIPSFLKKSTVVTRGEYKIGIIGTIANNAKASILASNVENYDFKMESSLVEAEAQRLRNEENCTAVVWLAHQGYDDLATVTGVDAIFGGHAHENVSGNIAGIPAAATTNYGQSVAHIELKINKSSKEVSLSGAAEVDEMTEAKVSALAENANIKEIINQYAPEINKIKNIKLGHTSNDLIKNAELKNICSKTMMEAAKEVAPSLNIDPKDLIASYHNVNGGIREDIKAGDITYGSVYNPFPFDNEIVFVRAKGTLLKRTLPNFDSLAICKTVGSVNDIDADHYYYLVLTDFIALSANFFKSPKFLESLTEDKLIRTGKTVRDEVAKFIYELDEVKLSDFDLKKSEFKSF